MSAAADYEYPSAEAEFGLYNFHSQEQVENLTDCLVSRGESIRRLVHVFGEVGSGRHYLLRAAAHDASLGRKPVVVASMDLDGYEPDRSLSSLLKHLSEKTAGLFSDRLSELARRVRFDVKAGPPSLLFASVGVKADLTLEEILEFFNANTRTQAGGISDRELLGRFLARVTETRKLVLHFRKSGSLDRALVARVVDELRLNGDLIVAFSYLRGESALSIRNNPGTRIEVSPWTRDEMARVFAERFQPNSVPGNFLDFAWDFHPQLRNRQGFATLLLRCVQGGCLFSDQRGNWVLKRNWQKDAGFVKEFTRDLYEPIQDFETRLSNLEAPEELKSQLGQFIEFAAMCDPTIAVVAVVRCIGLEENQVDEFIDLIDDATQVDDDNGLLRNVGFYHPGFPAGTLIYQFRNPARAASVLDRIHELAQASEKLLSFLQRFFRPDTRAVCEMFLNLTKLAGRTHETEQLETQLRWWTSIEETATLVGLIVDDLIHGEISPALVWRIVEETKDTWPPALKWALVEGYGQQPDGIPDHLKFLFHIRRGLVLLDLGRYAEALVEAQEAEGLFVEPLWRSELEQRNLAGVAELELREYAGAHRDLARAFELANSNLPPENRVRLKTMHNLAEILKLQGDLSGALALERQALAARRRGLGEEHPETLSSMSNLAYTLKQQRDLAGARRLQEQVLAASRRLLGDEHPLTLTAMHNFSETLYLQGDLARAQTLLERVLTVRRRVLGEEHPRTLITMINLAETLKAQGDLAGAHSLDEQVLAARQRQRSNAADHPKA
jgi:hypothetical protein